MFVLEYRPRDSFWGKFHEDGWNNDIWLFYSRHDSIEHQTTRRDKLNQSNRFYEYRVVDSQGLVV